jgi:DNA polymerase I-like protein with 3'-5' exonuclease and polymerase domains
MIIIYDAKSLERLSDNDLRKLVARYATGNVGAIAGEIESETLKEIVLKNGIQTLDSGFEVDEICMLAEKYGSENDVLIVSHNPVSLSALSAEKRIEVESPLEIKRYRYDSLVQQTGLAPANVMDFLYLSGSEEASIKPWAYITPSIAAGWLEQKGSLASIMRSDNSPAMSNPLWEKMKATAPAVLDILEKRKLKIKGKISANIDIKKEMTPTESDMSIEDGQLASIIAVDTFFERAAGTPLAISLKGDNISESKKISLSLPEMIEDIAEIELTSENNEAKTIKVKNFRGSEDRLKEVISESLNKHGNVITTDNSKLLHGYLMGSGIDMVSPVDDVIIMAYALDARNKNSSIKDLMSSLGQSEDDSASKNVMIAHKNLMAKANAPGSEQNARGYIERDRPISKIIAKMEVKGLPVDMKMLAQNESRLRTKASKMKKAIEQKVGRRISLDSDKDVRELLFGELGIKPIKMTATNMASVSEDALKLLSEKNPVVRSVIEYGEINLIVNKSFDPIRKHVRKSTQSLHATFDQSNTSTGRLSCSNPNLQGLPVHSKYANDVREAIKASKDKLIVRADYSQAELYVLASLSGCSKLQNALRSGEDIHKATAAEVFNKPVSDVSEAERTAAKAVNFGLIYGITEYGLGSQLGIPPREARDVIRAYFKKFPVIEGYLDCLKEHASEQGFVLNGMGRRIYFDNTSQDAKGKNEMLRSAINAPMQGTVADLVKKAMVNLDVAITNHPDLKEEYICLQVHDEIMVLADKNNVDIVRELIIKSMGEELITIMPPVDIEIEQSLIKRKNDIKVKELNYG